VKGIFLLVVILLSGLTVRGQSQVTVRNCSGNAILGSWQTRDSLDHQQKLQDFLRKQYNEGYLSATLLPDTTAYLSFCLDRGLRYNWLRLQLSEDVPADWLRELRFKGRLFEGKPVNPGQLERFTEALLQLAENRGFPFARVSFDAVSLDSIFFSARIRFDTGPSVVYKGVRLAGDGPVKTSFLAAYLQLNTGKRYDQRSIDQISQRLRALPYLTETEAARIYFDNNQAEIYVYTRKQSVNNFDGMLGIFPNSANNKLVLTGDLNLQLWSVFKSGEQLGFNFRSLESGTQDLKIKVNWPMLFKSPIGFDADFSLFKRDSTFLEVQTNLGLPYSLGAADWLRVYAELRTYSLLTTLVQPGFANVGGELYGLEYQRFRLNRALNPSDGYRFRLGAAAGERELRATETTPARRFQQYQLSGEAETYWHWKPRWITALELRSKLLFSDQIYQNEVYRLGGFKTLKGFDEASVAATQYLFLNIEQRFLLEQNSWLYLFWNGGWLQNRSIGNTYTDRPHGFGAGLTFQNSAGIFSLAYALGKERNNPFELRSAKVHLGYRYLL